MGILDFIKNLPTFNEINGSIGEHMAKIFAKSFTDAKASGIKDWSTLKLKVKHSLSSFLYTRTKRSPMLLPIIVEV